MNKNETVLVEREDGVLESPKRVEITKDNPSVLICVYGTLRRGHGNHRLLDGRAEFMGEFQSEPKYTMYGRGAGFPIVIDKGNTSITYEVFKVTNPEVVENCHNLEGCSGIPGHSRNWYDICPINTPLGQGWIYAMHSTGVRSEQSIIKSGNWNDRNK